MRFRMKKNHKKIILLVITIVAVVSAITVFALSKFDNTTDNVVSEDKTKAVILIDESYTKNSVKAKLVIENHNGFAINMFGIYCPDDTIHFDIKNESAFTIENEDTFNYDFTITFNEGIDSKDYLSLLENKDIFISFNANASNQNDNITQIQPVIEQGIIS